KYFTPKQEAQLKKMEDSGNDKLADMADNIRTTIKENWRSLKESELAGSDQLMVRKYASAVAIARKYNTRSEAVERAIAKLAYYTDISGEAKMAEYVAQAKDDQGKPIEYRPGMYVQSRPGVTATPPPDGNAPLQPLAP